MKGGLSVNKELPITFKSISLLIFILLLTTGFHYLIVDTNALKEKPVEDLVTAKHSKKGLYLYPRFEIQVEGSETPTMVSKEQFETITKGDTVSGFMRSEDTFMTEKEIQVELMIGIPILVLLYFVLFLWIIGLLNSTTFVKNRNKVSKVMKIAFKSAVTAILTIYLVSGFILTSLVAINVFHKLNKLNKLNLTETSAIVLGGDWDRVRSHRGGSYTTYELLLLYASDENGIHITKKAVTGPTYDAYEQGETITLFYRKNNEYDTFVEAESLQEVVFTFVNFFIFIIGMYLVSVFYLIRHWRKKRQDKHEQQEIAVIHN